jgi:hypothetical protein
VSGWSDISTQWLLLAHLAKDNVTFYHHLAGLVQSGPHNHPTNTNFIVFCLTRPRLVPTIYRTRGEHANHYATDAVPYFYLIFINFFNQIFFIDQNAALRRNSRDWLVRNQNNVSEWSDISTQWLLLAHLAKDNMSFYHHLAPVVRRLSFVVCRPLTIHILIISIL